MKHPNEVDSYPEIVQLRGFEYSFELLFVSTTAVAAFWPFVVQAPRIGLLRYVQVSILDAAEVLIRGQRQQGSRNGGMTCIWWGERSKIWCRKINRPLLKLYRC